MIDGGPLRTSRPSGRQGEYREDPIRYQSEAPPRAEPMDRTDRSHAVAPTRHSDPAYEEPIKRQKAPRKPRHLSWVKWIVVLAILVISGFAGWRFWPSGAGLESTIDTTKYQAVFLSNGQVYFGRLSVVNKDYMKLTNVYYLERQLVADTDSKDENGANDSEVPDGDNNFQLLKYSDVLYGSEDEMVISKEDIIRYENLRSDGVVARAIANRQ